MAWSHGYKLQKGQYTICRPLGMGGYGITYLAFDENKQNLVIKTLKDDKLTDPQTAPFFNKYLRDFRDEALRLSLCRHRHIVQIKRSFFEGFLPCIAMEYIDGKNLWEIVNLYGILSEDEALTYIDQIGQALIVVHEKGLLHRDVKPHNIMVRSQTQEAILIDFGIAREFIPDITMTHTQAWTHGFAPIEQYAEKAHRGEYTDVYALAATFYYILTHEIPPIAPALAAGTRLIPPQEINPEVSDRINQAIIAGMAFKPELRPQSIEEWLMLLRGTNNPPPLTKINEYHPNPESAVGANYDKLREFLAAGMWREADAETGRIMLWVACREKEGWLDYDAINLFPCRDLNTIDQLWMKYSRAHFGFGVQKIIWEQVKLDEKAFGDRVGWRINNQWLDYSQIKFNFNAPRGHLPWWGVGIGLGCGVALLSRRDI